LTSECAMPVNCSVFPTVIHCLAGLDFFCIAAINWPGLPGGEGALVLQLGRHPCKAECSFEGG